MECYVTVGLLPEEEEDQSESDLSEAADTKPSNPSGSNPGPPADPDPNPGSEIIPPPNMSTNTNNSIDVRKPDAFNGNKEKSSQFLAQVQIYILGNEEKFPNSKKKIIFMISYMNLGDAKCWANLEFKEQVEEQLRQDSLMSTQRTEEALETPWKWSDFLTSFHSWFDDIGLIERSYNQLKAFEVKRMKNMSEYVSKFRTLIAKAKITEEKTLVFLFSCGLSPIYYNRIRNNHVPTPDTIDRWYELAELYYIEYQGRLNKGRDYSEDTQRSRPSPRFGRTPFKRGRVSNHVLVRLSEAERHEKNLCFYCKKPGHMSRECPKKTNVTYYSTWTNHFLLPIVRLSFI